MNDTLVHINSRHRDVGTGSSTTDFTVSFNNSTSLQQAKKIHVKSVSFPNVFYNVNEYNNTFVYEVGGVQQSIQIAEGQYDQDRFIEIFNATLISVGMAMDIGDLSKKPIFTTTTGIKYIADISVNPMSEILGILEDSVGEVTNFSSQGIISLQGIQTVFLVSQKLGETNLSTSKKDKNKVNVLAVIPVDQPYGFPIHYTTQHSDLDNTSVNIGNPSGKNIQSSDIKLTDSEGRVLNMHGHHVEIVLKVYH
jgi:hypothetical protein